MRPHISHTGPGRAPMAEYDASLLWIALGLLMVGLVMVYSASIAMAETSKFTGGRASYFLVRHSIFLATSMTANIGSSPRLKLCMSEALRTV